jgi:3-hydroxybutyryl-CoA dehydratase
MSVMEAEAVVQETPELAEGVEFTTRGRTITEADLTSFSALTGDWHPQHSDAKWAARSRFGARVAHGMMVLSYALGLVRLDPERVIALRGLESVTFKRPVLIGDTIKVRCRVGEEREIDTEHSLLGLELRVLNQDERVVVRGRINAVWRRRTADEAGNGAGNSEPLSEPLDLYGDGLLL